MRVPALLAELRSRDIQIWADGDRLRCNAPAGVLTPELRDQLQQRKNDILEFLRSAGALAQQPRAIVPLQTRGKRTPVFAVPGHNGDVFCYRALAQHLGDDQPFYGLQPPGLDGHSEPLARVEDLAAYFAAQIRAFRPAGPCIIAGFCAGGTIAFELARQLLQERAAISFLALFGSPYPTSYRRPAATAAASRGIRSSAWSSTPVRWHRCRSGNVGCTSPRDCASARRSVPLSVRPRRIRCWSCGPGLSDITVTAVRRYTPGHFAGRVSLFLPCKEWLRSGDLNRCAGDRWRRTPRNTSARTAATATSCSASRMHRRLPSSSGSAAKSM